MINTYDPNICPAVHTVRVTFMQWGYSGHIACEIGGNCHGGTLLDIDTVLDSDIYAENDCGFSIDADGEYAAATLHDKDGNDLEILDYTVDEFKDMIVSIEIIAVRTEKENSHADT